MNRSGTLFKRIQPNRTNLFAIVTVVSAAAVALLLWLLYGRTPAPPVPFAERLTVLPAVNALLNGASALCLLAAYAAIRRRRVRLHRRSIRAALIFSTLFLLSYLVYHFFHGDTPFLGTGIVRPVYFSLLISHVVLSIAALPLILTTLLLAIADRFPAHRRLARYTWPVWMYVSLSGILVFWLLKSHSS